MHPFLSTLSLMVIGLTLFAPSSQAAERSAGIALLPIGDGALSLTPRIKVYIEQQYRTPVAIRGVEGSHFDTVPMLTNACIKAVGPNDICLVGLCDLRAMQQQVLQLKDKNCALVNISRLVPSQPQAPDRDELLARRLEKETLRAIADLLEVGPCPFPRCALFVHRTEGELDAKSRNPCPPCIERIWKKLEARGAELVPATYDSDSN